MQLGSVGRQLLALAREQGLQCYPLTATLRTRLSHRVDLHRVRKAVQALVAVRAVRTFQLPAAVPRAHNPQHLVLRETLWVQVTTAGEVLGDLPVGRHCAGWRTHQEALAAHFRTRYEQLAATDLFALYVEQVVAIVTAVTHQLVVATDAIMVARCAAPDSPYVGVFVHLDAVAPRWAERPLSPYEQGVITTHSADDTCPYYARP